MKEIKLSPKVENLFLRLGFAKLDNYSKDYYVHTTDGIVCRPSATNKLKPYKDGATATTYGSVKLKHTDGRYKTSYTHRLIGELIPHPPEKNVLHHKTYDKSKNGINDLEWLTRAEHIKLHQIYEKRRKKD